MSLRFLTAGESHGKALIVIVDGLPAGLPVREVDINAQLARRQKGYGRGGRMKIEQDKVEILAGIRAGKTIGSPVALKIDNRDWANWEKIMDVSREDEGQAKVVHHPRPGHTDLPGGASRPSPSRWLVTIWSITRRRRESRRGPSHDDFWRNSGSSSPVMS